MLAPIIDTYAFWAPVSVLLASLLGSSHCAAMCGGLVTGICTTRAKWLGYHAGRLVAYSALGALAGFLGRTFLVSGVFRWAAWAAAISMAAAFIAMGVKVWSERVPHVRIVPGALLSSLYRLAGGTTFLLGALSAALPCGWLQSFVLAAVATKSPLAGALLMATFWLGTLPALATAPWVLQKILKPFSTRSPRIAAVLLIAVGVGGLGLKVSELLATDSKPHCHTERP